MTCYGIYDNAVKTLSPDHILCGSNTSSSSLSSSPPPYCCASGTTCVGDSICHFTPPTSMTSGYYIGSCTDGSFNSSACSKECSNHHTQHIFYNATSEMWACCYGSGSLDCAVPNNNETFEAPAPELLTPSLDKQGSLSTTVSSPVVTSLVTPSPAAAPSVFLGTITRPLQASSAACPSGESCTSNTGLTTAAKAGSGVGASIFGIAILVTVLLLIVRRSGRRRSDADEATTAGDGVAYVNREWVGELDAKVSVELDSTVQVELPGSHGMVELA